jgi:elongation factor G
VQKTSAIAARETDVTELPKSWLRIAHVVSMTSDPTDALSPNVTVRLGTEAGEHHDLTLSLAGAIQLGVALSAHPAIMGALAEQPGSTGSLAEGGFVPVIEIEVVPTTAADRSKLASTLPELAAGDEQFRFTIDETSGRARLAGIDDLQLDRKIQALRNEHRIELALGAPEIAYREAITRHAEIDYTHKRLTGGAGQFARVRLVVEPNPLGDACMFRNQLDADALPAAYVAGTERGVRGAQAAGVLAGLLPVVRLRVFLVDAAWHDVDSSALAFELAARTALREAMLKAGPVLLEPLMRVEIVTPADCIGPIIQDLVSRRANLLDRGRDWRSARVIAATVPAANLLGYAASLRQMAQGRASYAVRFDHYAPVSPPDDAKFRPAVGMRV